MHTLMDTDLFVLTHILLLVADDAQCHYQTNISLLHNQWIQVLCALHSRIILLLLYDRFALQCQVPDIQRLFCTFQWIQNTDVLLV